MGKRNPVLYENKRCGRCKELKHHSEFGKDKRGSDGIAWQCKECKRATGREAYLRRDPKKVRDYWLNYHHGISHDDYERMLEAQGGGCAICGATEVGMVNHPKAAKVHLHVDHDHATGKIRGILCGPCNHSLGKMHDSPELLRRAAAYLDGRLI